MLRTGSIVGKRAYSGRRSQAAFSLIEITIASAIVVLLAFVAVPSYQRHQDEIETQQAVAELQDIDNAIKAYFVLHRDWPNQIADVGVLTLTDPWGNPYQYKKLDVEDEPFARKDATAQPVNQDYDLYSFGPDGESTDMLNAPASFDDVLRAQNGNFIGANSQLAGSNSSAFHSG